MRPGEQGKGMEKERWEEKRGLITVMKAFFVADAGQSVFYLGSSTEKSPSSSARF